MRENTITLTEKLCVRVIILGELNAKRTGTGPHLTPLTPQPPRPLFLPFFSHSSEKKEITRKTVSWDSLSDEL